MSLLPEKVSNEMEENGTCQKTSPTGIRTGNYKSELLIGYSRNFGEINQKVNIL